MHERWSHCRECRGTGRVTRARAYMDRSGDVSTVMAPARCPHCREQPGWQRGEGTAPPV